MNKIMSFSDRRMCFALLVAIITALLCLLSVRIAQADGAPPPEPDIGGLAPYQPIETNVQMMSEMVVIDVLPHPTRWTVSDLNWNSNRVKVNASFSLRNQGGTEETMQVIFPLSRLDYPWVTSSYNIISSSFIAKVNGTSVPTTSVSTPPELQAVPEGWDSTALPDGLFLPDVQWAGFDVVFPVQEDVIVEVEYEMRGDIMSGLHHVDYILETGAGWYGRILSADIIVHLPYPATSESIPEIGKNCVFSGNDVHCNMKNIEPKREDNLTFSFIDTNEWLPTLELRARVEQYPKDAESWYGLAERYFRLSVWARDAQFAIRDQKMLNLSKEAFERAVELNHNWGNAHLGLAKALWISNSGAGKLTAENPVVQQVLLEMQLAASHGITEDNYAYDELSYDIRRIIPDLNQSLLPNPIRLTSIPTAVTLTPGPSSNSLQQVLQVAVGNYHTCILTSDQVKCQGWNSDSRVTEKVTSVVAGDFFTCMLTTNGGVKCMGDNPFGQLGDGTTANSLTPVDVAGLVQGVDAIAAGDNHVCALMADGDVQCWGRNYFGQLGDGTMAYNLIPVKVHDLSGVTTLVAGSDHTCAVLTSGEIKCWGANESGQLGDGSRVNRLEPVDVVGLPKDVIELALGFSHTCALTSHGQVLCWGDNSHSQLGDSTATAHTSPALVPGLESGIVRIAVGNGYTCALMQTGGVKCLGRNDFGQLDGAIETDSAIPLDAVALSSGAVDIAAGNNHTCALLRSGRVRCWGMNEYAYRGLEAHYIVQFDSTPTGLPQPQSDTPTLIPTPISLQANASSTLDLVWDLIGLAAICGLALLWRRHRRTSRK